MRFPGRPELAQVSRVMTLGELTASIAHEVNQPLAAVVTNAQAGLRWLALETPRLDEARAAVERIVRDGNRASEVIQRIRALAKKNPTLMVSLDINEVIREAVLLVRREVSSHGVSLRIELAPALPAVLGDRIQLHLRIYVSPWGLHRGGRPRHDRQELQRIDRCSHLCWQLPGSNRNSSSRPRLP